MFCSTKIFCIVSEFTILFENFSVKKIPFISLSFLYVKNDRKMIEGPLSDLRQFLATKRCLKIMENVFYFMIKAPFVLEIFTF